MIESSRGLAPRVLVVGDPDGEFARAMVRLAREHDVEPVPCRDVYAAVAETATGRGRHTLILGRMRELSRENGRLFPLAAAHAVRCGCLLDTGVAAGRGMLSAALRTGATLVDALPEMRAVLQDWLTRGEGPSRRADLADLQDDDFRATEAELNALLGRQVHA